MIESNTLEIADFDIVEVAGYQGELSASVDWVDDAFGEIEAEAHRFAAVRVMAGFVKDLFSPR